MACVRGCPPHMLAKPERSSLKCSRIHLILARHGGIEKAPGLGETPQWFFLSPCVFCPHLGFFGGCCPRWGGRFVNVVKEMCGGGGGGGAMMGMPHPILLFCQLLFGAAHPCMFIVMESTSGEVL